uniref:Uncharacterized protein n=1 Tax=Parascaris equorum TaxID=6256 RepID=A0A914RQU5_PAREQ
MYLSWEIYGVSWEGEHSLKNEAGEACGSLRTVHLDITNQESVEKAVVFTEMQLSELWALVNNAGFLALYGPDDWCSIEDYEHSLKVNTLGHIRVIHAFRHLLERSKGRIITVTGAASRLATTGAAAYSIRSTSIRHHMLYNRTWHKGSSPCLDRVVACYDHAITARYPRYHYRCGCDAHFFAVLSCLPTAFADSIILTLCKTSVIPAVVTKDKKQQ